MTDPTTETCLNCGGREKLPAAIDPILGRDRARCRDCDWPWGEPPTVACPGCQGCRFAALDVSARNLCNGTGRIDASHLPLCDRCKRRHDEEHHCE